MKILWGNKDGGPESEVQCWGVEIKSLFSVMLLRFTTKSRNAYHSHAFWSISWLLKGALLENRRYDENGYQYSHLNLYRAGIKPIIITRDNLHMVRGLHGTKYHWALTFRGPWTATWKDGQPGDLDTLTHGRRKV